MNKGTIIPPPCTPTETTPFTTNSGWGWKNIVQAVQENIIPPNQFVYTKSQEQFYSGIGNIDFIDSNRRSSNLLIIEIKNQQDLKTYGKIQRFQEPIDYSVWNNLQPTETAKVAHPNILAGLTLLKEVIDFSESTGLFDYLQFAIEAIKSVFGQDVQLNICKDTDPEINEEWINIRIQAENNVKEIINKYDHVIELWVLHVPWPQRSMIRFSF